MTTPVVYKAEEQAKIKAYEEEIKKANEAAKAKAKAQPLSIADLTSVQLSKPTTKEKVTTTTTSTTGTPQRPPVLLFSRFS
jgi:hypothetical protein